MTNKANLTMIDIDDNDNADSAHKKLAISVTKAPVRWYPALRERKILKIFC